MPRDLTRLAQNQRRVVLDARPCGLWQLPGLQINVSRRVSRFLDAV